MQLSKAAVPKQLLLKPYRYQDSKSLFKTEDEQTYPKNKDDLELWSMQSSSRRAQESQHVRPAFTRVPDEVTWGQITADVQYSRGLVSRDETIVKSRV